MGKKCKRPSMLLVKRQDLDEIFKKPPFSFFVFRFSWCVPALVLRNSARKFVAGGVSILLITLDTAVLVGLLLLAAYKGMR